LKHDIYFEHMGRKIIIDTKYKITYVPGYSEDKCYGVAQSDLYQVISYAVRRKANEVFLIYPDTLQHRTGVSSKDDDKSIIFQVRDELSGQLIKINMLRVQLFTITFRILIRERH